MSSAFKSVKLNCIACAVTVPFGVAHKGLPNNFPQPLGPSVVRDVFKLFWIILNTGKLDLQLENSTVKFQ